MAEPNRPSRRNATVLGNADLEKQHEREFYERSARDGSTDAAVQTSA
jgi:hypothetical protein